MKITRTRIMICRIVAPMIIGVAGVLFYFAIDRDPPYEYIEGNIYPDHPQAGSQIAVHWHIRAKRFCPGWVERNITDRRGYVWHNIGGPVRPNAEREAHIVNTIELPRTLGPGPTTYSARVCYQCNPLHHFWPLCVRTPPIKFDVAG